MRCVNLQGTDINRAIFVIIVNDLCSILKNYGISEAYLE